MKYLQTKNEIPLIKLLTDETINQLNKKFGRHYKRELNNNIKIKRKEKSFEWWNRLIRTKPGFERGNNEK